MSGRGPQQARTEYADIMDPAVPGSLSDFTFDLLNQDGALAYFRGHHRQTAKTILIAQAATADDEVEAGCQLNNEYGLRNVLDPAWSVTPLTSVIRHGSLALIYDDIDAVPIDQQYPRPHDIDAFLAYAIAVASAMRCMHAAGIQHNNLKPASILVDKAGTCRIAGFGAATRVGTTDAHEHSRPFGGSLAYMSPEHTGRTRRKIDLRSDLYSLGVTLYEMLTGRLPFDLNKDADSTEWIHQHLASEPGAPHLLIPDIPRQLSLLVLKLLAKTPEYRYQTAAGVESDLKRCRHMWVSSRRINEFALGLREQAGEFNFSDRLYSRETCLQSLHAAFDQVATSRVRTLAVVHGESGVGKSSLLSVLLAQLRVRHAGAAAGKVDQYRKELPYAVLVQAFHGLIMHIVGQPDDEVLYWRQRLLQALGSHGRLAVNLIPALEHLVGNLPAVSDLSAQEAQIRFRTVMQGLVGAFAAPDRPLVLVIDDFQWIDSPSLQFLEYLMTCGDEMPLLLLIGYRNEAGSAAPSFGDKFDGLYPPATPVCEVELAGLNAKAIERMIADVLHLGIHEARELAFLVHEKTDGNPFFVRQFMQAIADDGLIVHDPVRAIWNFDLAGIRERGYTDNVAALVLQRLSRMPVDTQHALAGLACLGRHSPIETLAAILFKDAAEILELLEPALAADAIFLSRDGYGFCHDRVQEAATMLIDEQRRLSLHLAIGRQLLDAAIESDIDEDLFRAYDHLAIAAPLVVDPAEQLQAARLGLLAARKAKRAIAYGSALTYVETALSLLMQNLTQQAAELVFPLKLEQTECHLLCGKLAAASKAVYELLAMPASPVVKAAAYRLKAEIHLRHSENTLAVDVALEGLRSLDIRIERHPTEVDCELAYRVVLEKLGEHPENVLLALAPMQDASVEAAMALLSVLSVPASFTDDRLHFVQLCHTLSLTVEHGMTGASTAALSWFGVLVGHRFGKYQDGFRYGQLARALVTQHHYLAYEAKTLLPLDQLSVWTQPLSFSIDCARAGFAAGVAHGDITTACFECCHQVANLLTRGDHLDIVMNEAERGLAFVRDSAFQDVEAILVIQMRFIDNLRGVRDVTFSGDGILLSDLDRLTGQGRERMSTLVFWFWLYKAISHYLASEFEDALSCLGNAEQLTWSAPGHIHLLDYHLFYALTLAAGRPASGMQEAIRARIRFHYEKIAEWARVNPASFADKEALLQAELARLDGDSWTALTLYAKAIQIAEAQGFVQYAAYAHESAARLCLSAGIQTSAEAHLIGARNAYRCWGAAAKASQLEQRYPDLLQPRLSGYQTTALISNSGESRDMASVLRSVRALSEEIHLDSLIKVLMTITIEHAGAQRGLLLRLDGSAPFIAARAATVATGVEVELLQEIPSTSQLPLSMLQTAMRTLQRVRFAGGVQPSPFISDPYLQHRPQCAAMCIPLIKRGELVAVLYLENRLMPDAFTDEHEKVLEILAAQAAISLEVARLYADLVEENLQRQKMESALRTSEATLELGEQISHTGSWRWDIKQDVLTCSAEFCRIIGRDPEQRVLPFADFINYIHPDDRSLVLDTVRSSTYEQRAIRVEYRIIRPDGSIRYLAGVGKPSSGDDEVRNYVGTVTDITVRRASEDALRISQAELARVTRTSTVGQLTASIAHEINQPLMSIVSNGGASLRWLDRTPPEIGEVRAGLQDIVSEAGRAGHIIRSLQALTRNSEPVMSRVDLHDTVRHILAISRSEIERRAVSIELSLAADAYDVLGDGIQLQQVLLNLVVNAIDAMSEVADRPRVLSITSGNPEAGQIQIRVQDSGIGLGADAKDKIFEAFYTTKSNGMGMGLAICRSIAEVHRGRLEAVGAAPYGTAFYFVLPLFGQE